MRKTKRQKIADLFEKINKSYDLKQLQVMTKVDYMSLYSYLETREDVAKTKFKNSKTIYHFDKTYEMRLLNNKRGLKNVCQSRN